ncbi:gephyrin-like molybdotransferase Glp [Hoeflea sp. TYP-13]|uniref:molybdopterin molybdotransferase MoeA n=1 Tax=Hoeflea sp. TYP-13 TaxID=3230023 RepID=UPI0034C6C5EF
MLDTVNKSACGCDSPDGAQDLLPVDEAIALARGMATPIRETESVALRLAKGRYLAFDLMAPRAMPFFDNSAMDGYAVRISELDGSGPWELNVADTVAAGTDAIEAEYPAGSAVRIFTGAPVPQGFNAVIKRELCNEAETGVGFSELPSVGDNIRRAGEDLAMGTVLVKAGTKLAPRHIGLLAANGYSAVSVSRRVRVGVFSTGSEVVSGGSERDAHRIFDSNRPMLLALAEEAGAEATDLGIVPDDLEEMAAHLSSLSGRFDLLISSGAVSVGDRDLVRPAFEMAGGSVHNWRVAIKPGKPALFGTLGDKLYMGLPGNPLAVFVGFHLFAKLQIEALSGAKPAAEQKFQVRSGFEKSRHAGRTEYMPVRVLEVGVDGLPVVEQVGNGGSGSLYPLCCADGFAILPAACNRVKSGDKFAYLPLNGQI